MKTQVHRTLLALASILSVVVLRCSGSDTVTGLDTTRPTPVPTATPIPTPTPIPEGLTGTWVGTVKYAPAEYCLSPDLSASAEFVQHGSTVTATLHGACWRNARFEGSTSGATLVGRLSFGDYCDSQRQTHGEISPNSEIHISVTGFRGEFCAPGGSVVLRRR
jgi:hypothetical protein